MKRKTMEWNSRSIGRKGEVLTKGEYKCGFCRGTGLLSAKKGIRCPVCLGSGEANVESPAIICAYCNGTGKRHPRTTLTCTVCKGKGVVSVGASGVNPCPVCNGIGGERGKTLLCWTCKGTGVIK